MSRKWLITLEDDFSVVTYYKNDNGEYLNEKEDGVRPKTIKIFTSNRKLVEDVCLQVKGSFRVKEMPHKYGNFWRKIFDRTGTVNWATNTA